MLIDVLSFNGTGVAVARPHGFRWGKAETGKIVIVETDASASAVEKHYKLNKGNLELLPENEWRENIEARHKAMSDLEVEMDNLGMRYKAPEPIRKAVSAVLYGDNELRTKGEAMLRLGGGLSEEALQVLKSMSSTTARAGL